MLPCPIAGCDRHRRPEHAFCVAHWRAVPVDLKREVIRTWNVRRRARRRVNTTNGVGLRDHNEAMRAHLQALEAAQAAVEGRAPKDLFVRPDTPS